MASETIRFRPSKLLLIAWALPGFLIAVLVGLGFGLAANLATHSALTAYLVGSIAWLVVFAIGAGGPFWHFFSINYELTDRYVSVCLGIFWKVCRTTPLEKITNIDVRQGPVAWALGLGDIWIQTASSGSQIPEVKLTGLPHAKRIHQMIVERSDTAKRGILPSAEGVGQQRLFSEKGMADILPMLSQISETLKNIEAKLDRRG
jgi:membrane protein YdbS with pleckstrin-like domain